MSEDKRPAPKPRKHPRLWQAYLWWREMSEMRKRHILRISSIEKGKSNLDADFERMVLDMWPYSKQVDEDGSKLLGVEDFARREMIKYGREVGEIWEWLVSIRGIGEPTAAKLLAQFDDVAKFDTISKFWRFSGWATYPYWVDGWGKLMAPKDGWKWEKAKKSNTYTCPWCKVAPLELEGNVFHCSDTNCGFSVEIGDNVKVWTVPEPKPTWVLKQMIDRNIEGWHSPYNRILKSEVWIAVQNFVKHQTPVYVDEYYAEKQRLRKLHPEKVKVNGKWKYNDGHIKAMAERKTAKLFLSHLWVKWREFDGLSVTKPWIVEQDGHNRYIEPPGL